MQLRLYLHRVSLSHQLIEKKFLAKRHGALLEAGSLRDLNK